MFGWELPPHNSGGLGTACLGLTEGLASLGVDITFVVPQVYQGMDFSHMRVVGANNYLPSAEIQKLLSLDTEQQQMISQTLGYGNRMLVSKDRRLMIEVDNRQIPIAPQTQAAWYGYQAEAIAKKEQFDLVHCHDWFTYQAGIQARKIAHARGEESPYVAHVHATEYDRSSVHGDPAIVAIEQQGLREADQVIAVSHYTKEVVHKYYDVPREKISVVHNGISPKATQEFDLHALKKHFKIVLFMGRVTMQKGPDYFLKIAKQVTDQDPSVKFILVGSGDKERQCVEEAAKMGLTGKILFSSFLRGEDVDKAYQLANLFVMPSVSEPFGIVALEAIKNGTPVIVSKQSGVKEVFPDITAVDFWDTNAMAKAVLHSLRNPDEAQAKAKKARIELANVSWHNSAHHLEEVYHKVANRLISQPSLSPSHA